MRGRPRGPNPKTNIVPVRFSDAGIEHLDRLRGRLGRSTYLRELVRREANEALREKKK